MKFATTEQKARLLDLVTATLELVRDGKRNGNEVIAVLQAIKNQPNFLMTLGAYRELTVQSVRETKPPGIALLIDFEGCGVSFRMSKEFLKKRGIETITIGDRLLIKGRRGNDDVSLWSVDSIEDILKTHRES